MEDFAALPRAVQIQLAVGGPLLFGMITGFLLSETKAGWVIIQILAALGGIAAGFDHIGARAGAMRGAFGGFLFGFGIVLADAIANNHHLSKTPDPIGLIIVFTTIAGMLLGTLGGWLRSRAATQHA